MNRITDAKLARMEAESVKALAEAEAKAVKAEVLAERQMLADLRDRLPITSAQPSRGQTLQQEIESSLGHLMRRLGATESSVLVRDPDPTSKYLFFLAIHGEAASRLRKTMVGPDTIAGKVLNSGHPLRVEDPYKSPDFSPKVDQRTSHTTREMLTIPLTVDQTVVGVAQFLNRADGRSFSESDEVEATAGSGLVALKVAEFVRNPENYVDIGLYSPPSPAAAAIMFCDLSSSSSLFQVLHASGAITCINDYLSQTADIVLSAGGSVDQYLGDGAMFRFVAEAEADSAEVAQRATKAAMDSLEEFRRIKNSWLASRWEVGRVFSRIGISYGDFREPLIGPPRRRERVILGSGVHRAAELCDAASRNRNTIVMDARMAGFLTGENWQKSSGPIADSIELAIPASRI